MNIDFLTQCGRVKRTSVQMMLDRGYDVSDEQWILDAQKTDLEISLVFLKQSALNNVSFCSSLSKLYKSVDNPILAVHFLDRNFDESKQRDKMVSTDQFKSVIREFSKQRATKCLLIVPTKLSPQARKEAARSNLGIMLHEELKFNVAHHCMVPKHVAVSKQDADVFYASRKIDASQLPIIRDTDPVAKYYGYSKGTLVKIERPGWTVFRVVGGGDHDDDLAGDAALPEEDD